MALKKSLKTGAQFFWLDKNEHAGWFPQIAYPTFKYCKHGTIVILYISQSVLPHSHTNQDIKLLRAVQKKLWFACENSFIKIDSLTL